MNGFVTTVKLSFQDAFSPGMKSARTSFAGMKGALDKIGANSEMLQLSSQMSMATSMTEPLRQNLDRALSVPSRKAAEVESAMAAVHAVLNEGNAINGDVAASYDAVRASALNWAAGITHGSMEATASADQFVETTYQMVSAGLDTANAIKATESAMVVATATMGDTVDAAGLITDIYANMGGEIGNIGDVLARTQAQFKFPNLGTLTGGLSESMAVAQQFGVELPQLTAAIGMLNNAGIAGTKAGTSFKNMLVQLPRAAEKLGFEVLTTADGALDLEGSLKNLQGALGVFPDSVSQASAIADAFGTEAAPAIAAIVGDLKGYSGAVGDITAANGEATAMAFRMSDTYEDSAARLANVTSVWQTKIGTSTNKTKRFFNDMAAGSLRALTPLLETPIGGFVSGVGSAMALAAQKGLGFFGSALQVGSQLALLASTAQSAGGFIALFRNSLSLFKAPFLMVSGGLKKVVTSSRGLSKALVVKTAATLKANVANWAFASSMWAAAGPVLLIIGLVALVAAGAYLLIKHWDKVRVFFVNLWTGIAGFFKRAWDWIKITIMGASDWVLAAVAVFAPFIGMPALLIKHWAAIGAFFVELWDWVRSGVRQLINWAGGIVDKFLAPFRAVSNGIANLFGGIFGRSKASGASAMNEFAAGTLANSGAITGAVETNFTAADAYFPRSNAQVGPFSDLTGSGAALMETFADGVAADTELQQGLDEAFSGALPDNRGMSIPTPKAAGASGPGVINIKVETLTVQADDIASVVDFVHILQDATRVRL